MKVVKTFKIKNYKIAFITEVNQMYSDTRVQQHNIMYVIKKKIDYPPYRTIRIGNN